MGWPRDFLNRGVHIGGRTVAAGSVPESVPSGAGDGYPVTQTLPSNIAISPPSVLALVDLEGGSSPTATLAIYGYYPEETDLLTPWQLMEAIEVDLSTTPFVLRSVRGAERFEVIVTAITGGPTSVRLSFRAVSSSLAESGGGGGGGAAALELVNVTDSAVPEGDHSITGFESKVLLKKIKVVTASVNWTLTVFSKDDYTSDPVIVLPNRIGDWRINLDLPYEDKDATSEFHYNFTDHNGSNTHDIEVWGVKVE